MTDSVKATRAIVTLGSLAIDGFMLPDGSYRMSQAGAAEAIKEPSVYALRFLRSRDSKVLLGEAYTDYTPESVEVEPSGGRGQTRINALPLDVVAAYWLSRAYRGNQKAFLLAWALITETLERRFDRAFGVTRSSSEVDQRLSDRMNQLQSDLERLGDTYATDDLLRQERDEFYRLLVASGLDPYALPPEEGDRLI
ncbi:MAG: hypothetical protein HY785_10555 [Oscillatoriophycideae cyanobacterium NC_groundwater_1537_Pr4_S-0.65um_50_18]|nr:hypothetical protein [Oscillatoriophycideae cyanobacterium NC_groundwater_1537_Pr4_S-0.65um_50_18]